MRGRHRRRIRVFSGRQELCASHPAGLGRARSAELPQRAVGGKPSFGYFRAGLFAKALGPSEVTMAALSFRVAQE